MCWCAKERKRDDKEKNHIYYKGEVTEQDTKGTPRNLSNNVAAVVVSVFFPPPVGRFISAVS